MHTGRAPGDDADTEASTRAETMSDRAEPEPMSDAADTSGLAASAANSAKWAVAQTIAATGGRLLFTFVLARLLGPADFGVVAQATIFISLSMVLLDQGFGVALIQRRRLDEADVRSVAALNLALGFGLMVATLLLAPTIASFFRTDELTAVLRVLGVGLIIKGLAIVPLQMCRRAFQFRELALVHIGAVIVGGVVGLIAALNGAGYWALVVQTMLADALVLVGLLALRGLPRFRFDRNRLRAMAGFSTPLFGAQLLGFFGQNVDNIVIGRALGPTVLAFYALSFRIQRFPIQLIGATVNDVALSVFSRLQDEEARMVQWFLRATHLVTLLAWPPLVLISVSAPVAVPFLFGDAWSPAITPMQILGVAGIVIISRWLFRPMLTAHGRTDVVFAWSLVSVGLMTVSFIVAVQWGVNAVALAALIVPLLIAIPHTVFIARIVGVPLRAYVMAHVPAAVSCSVLAVAWWATAAALEQVGVGPFGVLAIATTVSTLAGLATARAIHPTLFAEFRELRSLSRGQQPNTEANTSTTHPNQEE